MSLRPLCCECSGSNVSVAAGCAEDDGSRGTADPQLEIPRSSGRESSHSSSGVTVDVHCTNLREATCGENRLACELEIDPTQFGSEGSLSQRAGTVSHKAWPIHQDPSKSRRADHCHHEKVWNENTFID